MERDSDQGLICCSIFVQLANSIRIENIFIFVRVLWKCFNIQIEIYFLSFFSEERIVKGLRTVQTPTLKLPLLSNFVSDILICDTVDTGKLLVLDGLTNLSEADTVGYTHALLDLSKVT